MQIVNIIQTMNYIGVSILTAIQEVLANIKSEEIIGQAGMILGNSTKGLILTVIASVIGITIGSIVMYGIGYYLVKPILKTLKKYFLIREKEIERAKDIIHEYGNLAVIVAKGIPVISSLISIPMGVSKANLKKFIISTIIGSIPWSLTFSFAGYYLGERWTVLGLYAYSLKLIGIIALDIIAIIFVYKRFTKPTIDYTSVITKKEFYKEKE